MRVAVCISGEMRTYLEVYNDFKKNLIEPFNSDVFISTWNESMYITSDGTKKKVNIERQKLIDLYNPVSLNLFEFKDDFFYEYEGVKVPEELIRVKPNAFKGNIPQFFLMHDCNRLKSKYEKKSNFKYDVVIRVRPDLLIFKKPPLKKIDLSKINLKHIINDTWYSDQFAISSSALMDSYTSIFPNLKEYWRNPLQDGQFKNILNGETLMRYHILKNELPHRRLYFLFPIVRFNDSKWTIFKKIYFSNFKNLIKLIFINAVQKKTK
jgi:hypothetical protein